VTYREGPRGYQMHFGSMRVPQSTYLLVAAVIVGIGGGYGAIAFRWLIASEGYVAFNLLEPLLGKVVGAFALVIVLACGGALAAWITARFAPEARGHGVPEVMVAVALHGGVIRPRVIGVKALASATSIGFGGSCGREGPIVQIGSAIGSVLGQLSHAPAPIVRTLVACGAAAGISATFNAPIGGVFFASEVILGDFAPRSFATIVVSSVLAAVVSRAYLGNHPSFNASGFVLVSPRELALYAILGIIAAFWAWGFVKMLYAFEDAADRIKMHPALKGAIGFGFVGAIGLVAPQILGVGYESMQHVLDGHVDAPHALALARLKPLATSLTLGTGGSGGVFAPSLFTGAMLGDAFGRLAHAAFPTWTAPAAAYGLVAMAAVFAAAAEAPITAIMIVFEMSYDYTIILPLMIATVVATILGRRLIDGTVYELKLMRRGIDWQRVRRAGSLGRILVSSVEHAPAIVAEEHEAARAVIERLHGSQETAVPVVDAHGDLRGIALVSDLAWHISRDPAVTVGSVARPFTLMLLSTDTLERAADLMADPVVSVLPIMEAGTSRLTAVVTRSDILDAYRSLAAT
jgi:CIC family chloride channel protein